MLACGVFGGSYTSAWVGTSYTVILAGMLVASAMFAIASAMPGDTRSKFQEMAKAELVQLLIGAFIIAVLMAFSATICNIVAAESQQLTGTSMQPFQYAEYFIGNLSQNTGLRLLSYLYTASMTYSITAKVFQLLPTYALPYSATLYKSIGTTTFKITPKASISLATPYAAISSLYMDLFSPLLTIAIGILFIMYLLLPILQYAAFAVVLPIAIIMRSIAYTGGGPGLRAAANSILAVTIAFYFIYPLTIALDHYMVNQIFTPANPEYAYLHQKVDLNSIPKSFFTSTAYTGSTNNIPISPYSTNFQLPSLYSMLQAFVSMGIFQGYSFLFTVPSEVQYVVALLGQFIFIAIFLFAIDLTITIAFAVSLFKALESGFGTR